MDRFDAGEAVAVPGGELTAEVSFDLKNDARKPPFWIARAKREELTHGRQNDSLRFAGADGADHTDARIQTTLRDAEPARFRGRQRFQLMVEFPGHEKQVFTQ